MLVVAVFFSGNGTGSVDGYSNTIPKDFFHRILKLLKKTRELLEGLGKWLELGAAWTVRQFIAIPNSTTPGGIEALPLRFRQALIELSG